MCAFRVFLILFLLSLQVLALAAFAGSLMTLQMKPVYAGIASLYDNRRCAVTITLDDLDPMGNSTAWQQVFSTLTAKHLYFTVGIITNPYLGTVRSNWSFIQYWLNQGYMEAGSHSRNHPHIPYKGTDPVTGRPRMNYEWQINGSRSDILGNLTLPSWQRSNGSGYVYTWIEPYGLVDSKVLSWLGRLHYIVDRGEGAGNFTFGDWDAANNVFAGVRFSSGVTPFSEAKSGFEEACSHRGIFHLFDHPTHTNWTSGGDADLLSSYFGNRRNVWYVPFGLLYLYHWAAFENITKTTPFQTNGTEAFEVSTNASNHANYGLTYPLTYEFNLPHWWVTGNAYYRHSHLTPWHLLPEENSKNFFNGLEAARFNFTEHKAYLSAGLNNQSDYVDLELTTSSVFSSITLSPVDLAALAIPAVILYYSVKNHRGRLNNLQSLGAE